MSHYSVTGRWGRRWSRWCQETFGPASFNDLPNRGARVAEEGIELAQAVGVPQEQMQKILERVYSRPAGGVKQEAAGVFITLIIFCEAAAIKLLVAVGMEWRRVEKVGADHFRAKQLDKHAAGTDRVAPYKP